jgi:hypothetical protein
MADTDAFTPRIQNQQEDDLVAETLRVFWQLQQWRAVFAGQWEEVAELIYPEMRNTFIYGNFNWPGQKKTQQQVDATGMLALQRFAAICDSLLTPANMTWHTLGTSNPYLNKIPRVRLWFEQATRILFAQRYAPSAGFMGQNHANYLNLGAFGTQAMFIDELDDPIRRRRGLRYRSVPIGEIYLIVNHQNVVVGFIRCFKMSARQCLDMFGEDRFPETLRSPLEQRSEMLFDFLHYVSIRPDYDPERKLHKTGKPWRSVYVSIVGKALLAEGGYRAFPLSTGRYVQAPNEIFGRSPAMMVLPALKTLNLEKRTFLKAGHRAADPVLLVNDDGLIDGMDLRPGAINKGGVNADGRPLVHTLPVGNIQIAQEQMQEERSLINDAFLVTLFQILTETPSMTATEVIERTNEKGILLAPTVGRQQAEYLGSMIERELDILAYLRMLPPMPGELIEARGEYEVQYTSPLSKAMRAQEAAGFLRTLETGISVMNATQDQSIMDVFNFDSAMPAIADIQSVPPSWMATPQQIAQKRKSRAQAEQQRQQVQAMPAQAAMMKAQAVVQKTQMQAGPAQPLSPPNQPGVGGGALQPQPQGQPQFAGGPAG